MARIEPQHISALLSKWTSVNADNKKKKKVVGNSYQNPQSKPEDYTAVHASDSDGEAAWRRFRNECVLLRGGVR